MAKSNWISSAELQSVARLIGECRELGDDPTVWRTHLNAGLGHLVGAELVMSSEVVNCLRGKVHIPGGTVWGIDHGFHLEGYMALGKNFEEDQAKSVLWQAQLKGVRATPGEGFTFPRQQVLDNRRWYSSFDYQNINRALGADACLHSLHPTRDEDHFDGMNLSRAPGRPKFTRREVELVRILHQEVARLVGGPLARWYEPAPSRLPPRVRQVLRCLLEGDSDKQTALRLNLSPHTVNQYTKQIYAFFKVNGRVDLLSRWLRRGWTSACRWEAGQRVPHWESTANE